MSRTRHLLDGKKGHRVSTTPPAPPHCYTVSSPSLTNPLAVASSPEGGRGELLVVVVTDGGWRVGWVRGNVEVEAWCGRIQPGNCSVSPELSPLVTTPPPGPSPHYAQHVALRHLSTLVLPWAKEM
ncbi:unnamed protein product [Lota lota]